MGWFARPETWSRRPDSRIGLAGSLATRGPKTNQPSQETAGDLGARQKRLADAGIQKAGLLHHLQLGAQLEQRASGDVQESQGVLIRPPTSAFGDVRRNGDRRAAQLIDEREVFPDCRDMDGSLDFDRESLRGLPCRKIAITDHLGILLGVHGLPIIGNRSPAARPAITHHNPNEPPPCPAPTISPPCGHLIQPLTAHRQHPLGHLIPD